MTSDRAEDVVTRPEWWQRRVGVYRGRKWHIAGGLERRPPGNRWWTRTLCGQWGEDSWHARAAEPPVCKTCLAAFEVAWGSDAHVAQTQAAAERLLAEPGFIDRLNEEAEEYERTADPATRWTPIEELGL